MKKIILAIFTISLMVFMIKNSTLAIPLNGEYTINVITTQIDADSWNFVYEVTNINQQVGTTWTGFAAFYVQVPSSANISNITVPNSYRPGGYWENHTINNETIGNAPEAPLLPGNEWIEWWAYHREAVYPIGSIAEFSFQADGVTLGTNSGICMSYWNWYTPLAPYITGAARYLNFSTALLGPVSMSPIPEPSTWLLLCFGLLGMVGVKKKFN